MKTLLLMAVTLIIGVLLYPPPQASMGGVGSDDPYGYGNSFHTIGQLTNHTSELIAAAAELVVANQYECDGEEEENDAAFTEYEEVWEYVSEAISDDTDSLLADKVIISDSFSYPLQEITLEEYQALIAEVNTAYDFYQGTAPSYAECYEIKLRTCFPGFQNPYEYPKTGTGELGASHALDASYYRGAMFLNTGECDTPTLTTFNAASGITLNAFCQNGLLAKAAEIIEETTGFVHEQWDNAVDAHVVLRDSMNYYGVSVPE